MSLESSVSFWDALSFWLITAGVILTFFGGAASIMFRRYNRQLAVLTELRNRDEKYANEKAIADAGMRAAEANARAEEAKRDAAVANENAERERLELIRVERRFAPRKLSHQEIKRIAAKLSSFTARRVTIVEARSDDSEAKDFIVGLVNILRDANWGFRITTEPQRVGRTLAGVLIVVNEDATTVDSHLMPAAECLVAALTAEGVFAQGPITTPSGRGRIFEGHLEPPILVVVGAKPDFQAD